MQARLVAHVGWLAAVLCLASCKDLTLPAPPDPTRPGTLSGRLVAALPGQLGLKAVAHARVQLLQADLTTFTDDHGYFLLGGVLVDAGDVLCSVDLDGDGQPDLQRLLTLQALHGRKGVDVSVGDLQLVQNATVRGKLRLGDVASTGGHAGTRVFLVDGPAVAITSDDGSFLLPRLPEGSVTLGFTHAGYQGGTFPGLDLVGGQDLALLPRDLEPDVTPSASVGLVGRALTPDGGAALDADVALHGNGVLLTAPVQADGGAFAFAQVPPGLYTLTAARPGAVTVVLPNLLLLTGTRDMHALVLLDLPPTPDGGVVDAGTPPPPPSGGQTPRVRVVPFAAGAQPGCGNAGYVLQSGLDLNGNGVLDPAEVTSRQVVCLAALVNLTPASRLACPEGGWILTTWVDASLDGVFQPGEAVGAPTYLCNAPPALVACQAPTLRSVDTGAYPWALAAADLDGDGRKELVSANGGGSWTVNWSLADGGYRREDHPLASGAPGLAVADLDLDGRPDVAVLSDDAIQPFLNLPDGGWQALPELRLGAPGLFAGTLLVGDLDRDGRPDLVAVSSGGLLGVALGRPGGAFTGPTVTAIPPSAVSGALYDRDGDGRLDLVLSFQDYYFKNLGLLAGLPDGGFGPPAYLPVATPYAPGPVTTGDFTGDGVTDVMFTIDENNNGDTVVLWPGLVDGGFVTPGTAFTVGRTLASIASGDLDGDGRLDVVAGVIDAVSHLGGVVQQLVGDGKGGFAPPLPDTTDPDPRTLLIADVNGDGQPDLLTGNLGTSLTLHLTSGPGCPLLGETAPAGGCPAGMVWVPGSRNAAFGAAYAAENQPQDAGIRGFCLDAHEVTVADYAVCVAARICPDDSLGTLPNYGCNAGVAGLERHPENCVRATSAVTYCATRGGRLPTQWEWEYAARWGHGGDYPWGTGAPKGAVCYADAGTCPAGGSPGDVSALGLFDLAGNVRELTSDGVTMGSAYLVAQLELLRAPLRFTPIDAAGYHRDVGFRCAAGASAGGPLAARTGTPKGPLSCRAYQAANGGLLNSNAVCNGNTADGYYWKVGAKVKEYGSSGLGGCGIPRCDASAVGATGQTASWQLSAEWWDTADTYVAGGPGGACPATDGQLFPCAAAHCGAYLATCTAQVAP